MVWSLQFRYVEMKFSLFHVSSDFHCNVARGSKYSRSKTNVVDVARKVARDANLNLDVNVELLASSFEALNLPITLQEAADGSMAIHMQQNVQDEFDQISWFAKGEVELKKKILVRKNSSLFFIFPFIIVEFVTYYSFSHICRRRILLKRKKN